MSALKQFRVAEVFGPTIQGEGRRAGLPAYFIRLAGCDFRCEWCDSPHAVLPEYVKHVTRYSEKEIIKMLKALEDGPQWVVLSGGNPALFDLTLLVAMLQFDCGYNVMVETQGSVWKDWLSQVDELCVSPKPPSAGVTWGDPKNVYEFMQTMEHYTPFSERHTYLKVVVFDDVDYSYARAIHKMLPQYEMFLSTGNADPYLPTVGNPNPPPGTIGLTQEIVLGKMAWLMEKTAVDKEMRDVRVLPQIHVLAWGNTRGR